MATKVNPGIYDCYARAWSDEPLFVLLARDRHAAEVVRFWVKLREEEGRTDAAKIAEARDCADAMERWRKNVFPIRLPKF